VTDSERSTEFWDAEADAFDDEPDHGLRDPATRDAWRALLLPLAGDAAARIADLGCGTGTLSVLLASSGHTVTGVDFSSRMIAAARSKAEPAGVDAQFVVADASQPPLADASFDLVLSRHVLWAMPDPGAALDRWIGLLAPGGVLALIEGQWFTGAGLPRDECVRLVLDRRAEAEVVTLNDSVLWGDPIEDDRYLLVSRR
jgi:SAM-dependent methyltransferase